MRAGAKPPERDFLGDQHIRTGVELFQKIFQQVQHGAVRILSNRRKLKRGFTDDNTLQDHDRLRPLVRMAALGFGMAPSAL
jgi:hypothetical protein